MVLLPQAASILILVEYMKIQFQQPPPLTCIQTFDLTLEMFDQASIITVVSYYDTRILRLQILLRLYN